jgi:hypothetical protein
MVPFVGFDRRDRSKPSRANAASVRLGKFFVDSKTKEKKGLSVLNAIIIA